MTCTPNPNLYKLLPTRNYECPPEADVLEIDADPMCCTSASETSKKYLNYLLKLYTTRRLETPNLPSHLQNVMKWLLKNSLYILPGDHIVVENNIVDIVKFAMMVRSKTIIQNNFGVDIFNNGNLRLYSDYPDLDKMTKAMNDVGVVPTTDVIFSGNSELVKVPAIKTSRLEIIQNQQTPVDLTPVDLSNLLDVVKMNVNEYNDTTFVLNRPLVTRSDPLIEFLSFLQLLNPDSFKLIVITFHTQTSDSPPSNYQFVNVDNVFCKDLAQILDGEIKFSDDHVTAQINTQTVKILIKMMVNKIIINLRPRNKRKRKTTNTPPPPPLLPPPPTPPLPNYADSLRVNGYVVIPTEVFKKPQCRDELFETARGFQEYKEGTTQYVMGTFAALNNPSSFHNHTVRKFRQWAHAIAVTQLFKDYIQKLQNPSQWKLDHIIGRMMMRTASASKGLFKESWHRDEASKMIAKQDDKVFGGWINFDRQNQVFSCLKGSHIQDSLQHGGFHKFSIEECKVYDNDCKKTLVTIPPGAMLIFFENIIHEVKSKKVDYTMTRLHLGFRLTRSPEIRPPNLMDQIDQQAAMMIKSGQKPVMYSSNHISKWIDQLVGWTSKNLNPDLVRKDYIRGGKGPQAGQQMFISPRVMTSLKDYKDKYGFTMYDSYTNEEKHMHTPQRQWRVLKPGSVSEYITVSIES